MVEASWHKHLLLFDRPRGTSRGAFTEKPSWYIVLRDGEKFGIGECGLLPGLSIDDRPNFEDFLVTVIEAINKRTTNPDLTDWPSIQFGLEMAQAHLRSGKMNALLLNSFSENGAGIDINGLVWMGSAADMRQQISEKIEQGFTCIKIKIGAINFEDEISLIAGIRKEYSKADIEIRVDANGAFTPTEAMEKLERLAAYELHSIEQPIKAGQWNEMAMLCEKTPLPIALDEELIGVHPGNRAELMSTIKPQAIILKPSLVGGWKACDQWIELAENQNAIWWLTSALESNIGLNAIAQYASFKNGKMPQGLGTGMLYTNNYDCPLEVSDGKIWYRSDKLWKLPFGLHEPI